MKATAMMWPWVCVMTPDFPVNLPERIMRPFDSATQCGIARAGWRNGGVSVVPGHPDGMFATVRKRMPASEPWGANSLGSEGDGASESAVSKWPIPSQPRERALRQYATSPFTGGVGGIGSMCLAR